MWSETHPQLNRSRVQTGLWEHLLCLKCEGQCGKLESYAKPVLFGATSPIVRRPTGHHVWTGLDYTRMKLFHMSILWRTAVSSLPFYAFVTLPDEEKETLRAMLLANDPGEPWQYGCLVDLLRYRNKPLLGIFSQPRRIPIRRDSCVRLILAGMQWFLFESKNKPQDAPIEAFLSLRGTWPLLQGEAEDFDYLRYEIADHKRRLLAHHRNQDT